MTDPGTHHHLQIKEGEQTVAAADVTIPPEEDTAQASLRASPGHIAPGQRASLVDAVMDLPEVQDSAHLAAAVPLGDSETLGRLRERSENATTRPAGTSALFDADIPDPLSPADPLPPADPPPPINPPPAATTADDPPLPANPPATPGPSSAADLG
ncbi:MAG TPA: hypothetical protein VG268_08380 [Streptosporangiaceae bacterium]|jgi:hypothetical protein|nr:hypothetical protein [Streptosporangiaceae bacterium]